MVIGVALSLTAIPSIHAYDDCQKATMSWVNEENVKITILVKAKKAIDCISSEEKKAAKTLLKPFFKDTKIEKWVIEIERNEKENLTEVTLRNARSRYAYFKQSGVNFGGALGNIYYWWPTEG